MGFTFGHALLFGSATIFLIFLFSFQGIDCDANPPMVRTCQSNNLIDSGLDNCIKIQSEENYMIFPDVKEKWSCNTNTTGQMILEIYQTKCNYSPSNLTSDYSMCEGIWRN